MAASLVFEIENELGKKMRGEVRLASAVCSLSGCLKGRGGECVYGEQAHRQGASDGKELC